LKNLLRNRNALSPVVAAIILIAVTVAVSIAVVAWMGTLTIGFMGAEQLKIINVTYNENEGKVIIKVTNTGSSLVTITDIRIDGISYEDYNNTSVNPPLPYDLKKGLSEKFIIQFGSWPFKSGVSYGFTVITSKGDTFGPYMKLAPS